MIRKKGRVSTSGRMAECMTGNGRTMLSMVSELTFYPMANRRKEGGRTAGELNGFRSLRQVLRIKKMGQLKLLKTTEMGHIIKKVLL